MQDYSNISNFAELLEEDYRVETKVVIDGTDYGEDVLQSLKTSRMAFDTDNPSIGQALAGQIELSMIEPDAEIPRRAEIDVYIRLAEKTNSNNVSGWLPKGVFNISSRDTDEESRILHLYGNDTMRKADVVYPASALEWSSSSPNARAVLEEIAGFMGVELDDRTKAAIPTTTSYIVSFPAQYTMREVLASIAAMYGGSFLMSDDNKLLYIGLTDIPQETYYLTDENGNCITFGGTRILLQG